MLADGSDGGGAANGIQWREGPALRETGSFVGRIMNGGNGADTVDSKDDRTGNPGDTNRPTLGE